MNTLIRNILLVILSYLAGSLPFCYLIARLKKKDLTKLGDKNPGGWNLAFNVSKPWGLMGALLDVAKGFLPYFIILRYTGSEFTALIAGCAVIAGHNYSPFLKFSGGKGIASLLGLLLAIHPFSVIVFGTGIVLGLVLTKNMIWGVVSGMAAFTLFFTLYFNSGNYIIFGILLFLIIIPKYVNHSIPLTRNFKFRKEKALKDLFTPKVR
ncbi:MAG: glycerol-3-phosphate acyltransferase [Actinomycetota bacterium]